MIAFAMTPERLGGPLPLLSLARNDADFNAENGCYWRGSLWLPTAYMAVKALEKYGEFELARDCARKILEHQYRTFAEYEPHTVWECYAPNAPEPAVRATKTAGLSAPASAAGRHSARFRSTSKT